MTSKIVQLGNKSTDGHALPISASFDLASKVDNTDASKQAEMMRKRLESQGRFVWSKLHGYRGCDPQWLEIWEYLIPKFGCSCTNDYQAYKASTPPDFTSPESLWLWGVALHNHVNRKLGKPELTVDEARLQWSRLDGLEHKQG